MSTINQFSKNKEYLDNMVKLADNDTILRDQGTIVNGGGQGKCDYEAVMKAADQYMDINPRPNDSKTLEAIKLFAKLNACCQGGINTQGPPLTITMSNQAYKIIWKKKTPNNKDAVLDSKDFTYKRLYEAAAGIAMKAPLALKKKLINPFYNRILGLNIEKIFLPLGAEYHCEQSEGGYLIDAINKSLLKNAKIDYAVKWSIVMSAHRVLSVRFPSFTGLDVIRQAFDKYHREKKD